MYKIRSAKRILLNNPGRRSPTTIANQRKAAIIAAHGKGKKPVGSRESMSIQDYAFQFNLTDPK